MRNSHEETHLCLLREKKLPNLRFLSVRDEHKAIFPYFCSQNSMNHALREMMNQRDKERKKPSFQGNPPRRAKVNERATEYPVAVLKSAAGGSLLLEARHALQAERRADKNTVGERQAARRCVIIANLLRCYRIRIWSYTSVHSLHPHPQRLAS